jgi:hypothetical protein
MIGFIEIFMAVIIAAALILILILTLHGRRHKTAFDQEYYQTQWQKVVASLKSGDAGWRLAIIDADKLCDQALRQHGAAGETMGERLRDREKAFSRYNDLWSAHKFRNKLVHEPNVKLTQQLAERILREFARALKELGALE